jgi:hypothetical protein
MLDGCWLGQLGGCDLATCWINTAGGRPKGLAAAAWVMLFAVWACGRACPAMEFFTGFDDPGRQQVAERAWDGWRDPGVCFWTEPPGPLAFTVDYRVLAMFGSQTSKQFGTPPQISMPQYAPLSKLDWSLDSAWTGFRFGLEQADSAAHLQWMTPMGCGGKMDDFDWSGPDRAPASLSSSPERFTDGQMLDLEYEFRLLKRPLTLPVDVWPLIGFRWQRFDITAYDGDQLINDGTLGPDLPPVGYHWTEDMGTFKQEYSIGYVGAQLRGRLETGVLAPIAWTLQGDWGYTQANNIDHHISGYEEAGVHRFSMEDTHGSALHFCLTTESLFCRDRLSLGLQADYMEISTTGSHRLLIYGNTLPTDETWSNGVSVSSRQIAITAFLRIRI